MIYTTTSRLALRDWQETDLPAFSAMNGDARVMEHFPATLSKAESATRMKTYAEELRAEGFGLFALERLDDAKLIGFCGLHRVHMEGELNGSIELAWRLIHPAWGFGYATEAARACLLLATQHGLKEVVAFTALSNHRSERVMQRLGMQYGGEFDHPALPEADRLRRHVWYRIGVGNGV